jgi:hypothetical protein
MAVSDIPPDRRLTLAPGDDGVVVASYTWKTYRFMFSDGRFVDVRAIRDDSDLRGFVLEYAQAERIEGVARLDPAPEPARKSKPRKRVAVTSDPSMTKNGEEG